MPWNRLFTVCLLLALLLGLTGIVSGQDSQPQEQQTYVIQPGDTLNSIARRFNTTVRALTDENNIANPQLIYWGQTIRIPSSEPTAEPTQIEPIQEVATPTEAAAPSLIPETTAEATSEVTPVTEIENETAPAEFGYGIEANLFGQDVNALAGTIDSLGVNWVEQVVSWRDLEPVQGQTDFSTLDTIVAALESQGVHILLTVTAAPDWSRSIEEEVGPPDDYASFATFMSAVASHYAGRVAAYQIWNEPNLRNRWRSTVHAISPEEYLDLLRQGHQAVKAADPNAAVISAGLAVTGFNDALNAPAGEPVNAINDRVFLSGLYAAGLADVSDGIGAHPIGWANPPDARCCEPAPGVLTHYEDRSFYFLHTLEDYREIQVASNDAQTPIWVTRFAWGTSEDLGQPDAANIFTSYTSLDEQAAYTVRAYEIGAQLGYVGPMFAYNLNGCQAPGQDGFSSCYYSFIGPDGMPRPVFQTVLSMNKGAAAEPIPTTAESPEATAAVEPDSGVEMTPESAP